jgi:8-oxo-dGTP diphosphatase
MVDKLFVAMKAFIVHDNKVLILRESNKYSEGTNVSKYDFPGGRVKPGERFDEGLLREIKEETGLEVDIKKPLAINEWRPEVKGEKWQIVATFIECSSNSKDVKLSDDHDEYLWINPKEFSNYNIIKTNLVAFENYLNKN